MIREQTQRTAGTGPNRAEEIYEKCLKRDPLTAEEAYWLYEQAPLQELALTADRVRRAVVPDLEVVTWQIDRNVNQRLHFGLPLLQFPLQTPPDGAGFHHYAG